MENKNNIYLLAQLLDLEFMVYKKGVLVGRYRYFDGKLFKIN